MSAPTATRAWFFPTLRGYHRSWIGPDIVAGLSAGAVVVPQAMAYATIASLPVQIGLYTCMVPMLVYAMLGGSRAMSVSTTSTIATLTATTLVSAGVAVGSDDPVPDLMALTLLVGVILLIARVLKLGGAVEYISKPTIIGVQVGVGATVAVGQLPKLIGVDSEYSGSGFIRSILGVVEAVPGMNLTTGLLSIGSIAVLVLLKRFLPRVPAPLIVVAAGILLAAFAGLKDAGVELIAPVPQGFPPFELPTFAHIGAMVPGAFAISIMAFLESSAVARGIREAGEPQIDSNRELMATGAANAIGSFFQVLPAAGGFSQSAVNKGAGAKSQIATVVTVILALLVALFLGPVLSLMPQATLAALVFVAVVGLIDVKGMARLWRLNRADFWVAASTAFVGLTAGLLLAVAVGVIGTFVVVFRELNRVRISVGDVDGDVLPVKLNGPVYTANALPYETAVLDAAAAAPGVKVLALQLAQMRVVSVTVLDTLTDLDTELAAQGIELRLAAVPDSGATVARRGSWYATLEADGRVYETLDAAVRGRAE
ncbi:MULTISPECIES: SulP family inorganic anion transporter [unclassified Microbacterium]|uniref:SulP family inorganic anion transporter n=1 Tax=unclassified Microbacterium TaxID=2609290 RepID=UPI0012FCB107|nr:SulP family inorganic anion transporter [Microbacterium sp. MAH-37]MVQ43817.1 STAS domain-containing protein [Microbacterium sp. MAH-37]